MSRAQLLYLFSQGLIAFFNWLILVILAKKFSGHLLGEYSLALAYITPTVLLYALQMRSHYLTNNKYSVDDYICMRLILIKLVIIVACVFSFIGFNLYLGIGVALLKVSDLIQELPFMIDQKKNQLSKGSIEFIIKVLMTYSSIFLLIYLDFGFIISLLVGSLVGLFVSIFYLKRLNFSFKFNLNKSLFKSLLPFGLSAFVVSMSVMLPRILIERFEDLENLALYTVVFVFFGLWQLFFNNYFNGILEKLKNLNFRQKTIMPLSIFALSSIIFILFDKEIYKLFFGANYIIASKYTPLLLINILLSFITSYIYYDRVSKMNYSIHLKVNTLNLVLVIIFNFVLIYHYSITGAFIAQGLSLFTQSLLYYQHRRVI